MCEGKDDRTVTCKKHDGGLIHLSRRDAGHHAAAGRRSAMFLCSIHRGLYEDLGCKVSRVFAEGVVKINDTINVMTATGILRILSPHGSNSIFSQAVDVDIHIIRAK